jgi:hypothetical protein
MMTTMAALAGTLADRDSGWARVRRPDGRSGLAVWAACWYRNS